MRRIFPPGVRSKYICIPSKVIQAGNHIINELEQGMEINVPPDIGLLHHYRGKCVPSETEDYQGCLNEPSKVDRSAHKFKERLLQNINKTLIALSNQCNLS